MRIQKVMLWSLLLCLLQGCVNLNKNPAENLLGKWQVNMAGIDLMVEYSETMVQIGENAPVSYSLAGNELSFLNGGSQKRIIFFKGKNEMIQTDPLTNTERVYSRM